MHSDDKVKKKRSKIHRGYKLTGCIIGYYMQVPSLIVITNLDAV